MSEHIMQAVEVITSGGVIAYPTEAVWGLGCDPWNETAVQRILAIKRRPISKGLILVASCPEQIAPLMENLNEDLAAKILAMQTQPLTWLVPDEQEWIPAWIKGDFDSVAVRISQHPVVTALCDTFGKPLVSTSANLAGASPLLTREDVVTFFESDLDWITQGATGDAPSPSRIRDLVTDQIFR